MRIMFQVKDIHPVSDFSRKPAEVIKRLKASKRPEILTVNGSSAVVIQDAQAYEEAMALIDSLKYITVAKKAFDKGEGRPAKEAFADLKNRLQAHFPDEKI